MSLTNSSLSNPPKAVQKKSSSRMMQERKCSHIIRRNKYERNAPEIGSWWYKLFNVMEKDAAIPPDKRLEVLNEIFPTKLLNTILSILSLEENVYLKDIPPEPPCLPKTTGTRAESQSSLYPSVGDFSKDRIEVGKQNPYVKFFERRPDRAAIWHTLPPLTFTEMNLSQKAEAVTMTIARDFVNWMIDISDADAPTILTIPSVIKMFEIGFNNHAAQSLQVRVKEMASVPDGVALLKNMPEMAKRTQLHMQLYRDLQASKKRKRVFAFGTKLEPHMQVHPPNVEEVKKWLVCNRVPGKLKTMAAVWQGITHLRSTRAYCDFLIENPHIKPPPYLKEQKMLDPVILKAQRFSQDREGVPVTSVEKETNNEVF